MRRRWEWLSALALDRGWTAGIEIGVLSGQTLAYLLRSTELRLIGIDSWTPTADYPGDRQDHFEAALLLELVYPRRLRLIRGRSQDVHDQVADGSVDFVFIDADHAYPAVRADIELYRPKLRPGGMLAGHDYGKPGVRQAVEELLPQARTTGFDGIWYVDSGPSPD